MEHPLQIVFRGFEPSDAAKAVVEEKASSLERFYNKIESCRVVLELPHRRETNGRAYHVGIRVRVPGDELVVSHAPKEHVAEELETTINHAVREMQDYVGRRRRQ